ncbi:uncharacterized protein BXIN_2984 [Babesia sp. Xinjiang]|uniref:uncharacterized protein n=1 Tax=Babesia sp. Xinjiang TaxID=462227 RepID=UPI000A2388EE|nr:uncharacterized protein BXIN_2984 [Babesia sp. Xinjiang]ORM39453.1 hypothetical protein BXIN_2984 [Babesia sp. Xinjiang]
MSYLAVIAIIASLFTQPLTTAEANDCVRDYTKPCAEGWTESLVFTRVCEAPIFYHGPCSTNLPFVDTKEDKLRIEQTCGITWPCYSYCDIDENAKCPKFWYMEDGLCVPSAAYHGKSTDYYGVAHDNVGRCVEPADLTKMHETERTLWGNRCGVAWPCNRKCTINYQAECPEGWKHTGIDSLPSYPIRIQARGNVSLLHHIRLCNEGEDREIIALSTKPAGGVR